MPPGTWVNDKKTLARNFVLSDPPPAHTFLGIRIYDHQNN